MDDAEHVAASLAARLDELTFVDLTGDEATARIIDAVAAWADGNGWRVYRRAPSVVTLPPPMDRQHSVLDVACARPDAPPVVVEVDGTDRRRTVDKLIAEAQAGRVAIWVRWGTGSFTAPPGPVQMVTCVTTRRAGAPGQGRLHSRMPVTDLPPPPHSTAHPGTADVVALPLPEAPGP
jgi:hypothetical protein